MFLTSCISDLGRPCPSFSLTIACMEVEVFDHDQKKSSHGRWPGKIGASLMGEMRYSKRLRFCLPASSAMDVNGFFENKHYVQSSVCAMDEFLMKVRREKEKLRSPLTLSLPSLMPHALTASPIHCLASLPRALVLITHSARPALTH